MTITVRYTCHGCGLRDVPVKVPARTDEDVVKWMEATMLRTWQDHNRRSPECRPRQLSDLKIPLHGTDRIGGPVAH